MDFSARSKGGVQTKNSSLAVTVIVMVSANNRVEMPFRFVPAVPNCMKSAGNRQLVKLTLNPRSEDALLSIKNASFLNG
jgi:cytochrome c oxidase assembly protein Cox11